ncbi:hypothetical protein AAY80_152 [Stenotrophomonas phage vB_SmaS-DLP_6]|nr:hypothetical protein AAY80_152 [Stenotrophomonas phage vB_SmaS-DLP_6]
MPNRNWKSIATPEWHTPRLCFVWHMQSTMHYAERRAAILKHLDESSGIYINCKYQVQLKDKGAYPKALKRMLKEGVLKRVVEVHGNRTTKTKLVRA